MKKAFTLIELIISISLISLISTLGMFALKKSDVSYADPYLDVRSYIIDATNVFLSTNAGIDYKNELNNKKQITIKSNILITEGLIDENYYVKTINEEKNLKDIDIIITLDEDGFTNYTLNIN